MDGFHRHPYPSVLGLHCHRAGNSGEPAPHLCGKPGPAQRGYSGSLCKGHRRYDRQCSGSRGPELHHCGRSLLHGRHCGRLHHCDRSGLQAHQRRHRHQQYDSHSRAVPFHRAVPDHALLHCSGHGRSHHSQLLHHGLYLRPHFDPTWHRQNSRSLLCFLFRHRSGHYASCGSGCLRRQRYRQVRSHEDRH